MSKPSARENRLLILSGSIMLFAVACLLYLTTGSYSANEDAAAALGLAESYTVQEYDDGILFFVPDKPIAGLIFYPGGKVESRAYASLMAEFAQEDILCVLLSMPFDLAVFDINAADGILDQYPEIGKWYLAGHSLGGAMAASYAADHSGDYEGLFLLAAYSTSDLTDSDLDVVSLYGSEDRVLNMEKYAEYWTNLPESALEFIIDGGCHAYFGSYGPQKGDGSPVITNEEQIRVTVEQCLSVIERK